MASLSTTESTPVHSPNPKLSLRSLHMVQCNCDLRRLNFIKRYLSFNNKSQTVSCWKVQEWLKYLNFSRDAEFVYFNLLKSNTDLQEYNNSFDKLNLI